ncbi:hypothetical protein OJAV_G00113640 [Oryzias javanicus]|uniref:C-type lectin domain-containing protein n=1 Tax=Oryzias javanicus TaxID=123683 RepID=A0A3S2PQD3_ORYJA|nr:hypothetical protein OJAV_G00113640 [Oryzias javanicus]
MPTKTQAAADSRVKFNRNLHQDGREQSEVEMIDDEDQIYQNTVQPTGEKKTFTQEKQTQKNIQAETKNFSGVFKLSQGVFLFLLLAGLIASCLHWSSENKKMQTQLSDMTFKNSRLEDEIKQLKDDNGDLLWSLENQKVQTQLSDMTLKNSRLEDEIKQLKDENEVINKTLLDEIKQLKDKIEGQRCPETWMRFGHNCYYKSTEDKNWINSRRFCQYVGADLLVINSKEEQDFVSKLNPNAESWIGLYGEHRSSKTEWKWVDGSLRTEAFWENDFTDQPYEYYAVSLNAEGKWTNLYQTKNRNWICEK